MTDSILNSTKKLLHIDADYTEFDLDIITHINSVFSTLNDLGIGPSDGFMIMDSDPTWADFLGDIKTLNSVKTYMVLRVRLLFDPPTNSFAITAMQKQVEELEYRINLYYEMAKRAGDFGDLDYDVILDGGAP